jgi:hypothetical protein
VGAVLTKQSKKKIEYRQGPEAKEAFEKAMKGLFQVPKPVSKKPKKGKDRPLFAGRVPA